MTHPSRVGNASDGAAIWLRLPLATRFGATSACSTTYELLIVSAVARSDACTS